MSFNRLPITLREVNNFLAQQNIIRIFFDSVQYGYGNQASNKNLMKKIRQLGFVGKFEVIYFKDGTMGNHASETNKAKIARLFDLPDKFSDVYYDQNNHIEFIEATIFHEERVEMDNVLISLSGSQLPFCMDAFTNKKLPKDSLRMTEDGPEIKEPACDNEARLLKSNLWLNIQPYYGAAPRKREHVVKFSKNKPKKIITFEKGATQFFNFPTETLEDAFNFLDTSRHFIPTKSPALKRLMLGLRAQEFHTIPIHGWPVQLLDKNPNKERHKEKYEDFFPGKILHYICAAAEFMQENAEFRDKPLLMPIFYDYEQELKIINNIIIHGDWGKYSNWKKRHPQMANYIKTLQLKNNFKIATIKDRHTIAQFNQLQAGDIMLVSIGKLPQPLFNGLYIDAGGTALTHIFEGENTRNALLSSPQKPFLRSEPWNLDDFGLKPQQALQDKYNEYDTSRDLVSQSKWVASFILAAQKNDSDVTNYFKYIYEKALAPDNDRILSAIKESINLLLEDKLITREELNNTPAYNYQLDRHENLFNSLSNVFKNAVIKTEAKFLVNMSKFATSCPSYFHEDHIYWKNTLNPPGLSSCASAFFSYQAKCIAQPQLTASVNPHHYLKF